MVVSPFAENAMQRWMFGLMLLGALTLAPRTTLAQENQDFEMWEESQGREQPVGWRGSPFGMGKSEQARNGKFAATVWNWYYYGKGYLMSGSGEAFWMDLNRGGTPISWKPAILTGYYRYNTDSNSRQNTSGIVAVMLRRWNPQTQRPDTIGFAEQRLSPSPVFRPFTLAISDYAPGVMPDTMVIAIISSDSCFCASESSGNCCYLTVDDLRLRSSASGVEASVADLFATVRALPNPVADGRGSLLVEWPPTANGPFTLRIISSNGQILRTIGAIEGTQTTIQPNELPGGRHLMEVRNRKGEVVGTGTVVNLRQ